jgi:hypothetical protein
MTGRVRQILNEITALEGELRAALNEREQSVLFEIRDRRIRFRQSVREAHLKLKKRLPRWLGESSLRAVLSVPFIYSMIVPLLLLDAFFTAYQAICFRLYRIAPVRRSDYIAMDHRHLAYLNSIEKLNCVYCGYANGLIAYAAEIAARTEQYWCPIKHARQMLGSHARSARFVAYGNAADYHDQLEQFRQALAKDGAPPP